MQKELMITLWNGCYNRCFFCYNRGYYHFPIDLKAHLKYCLELLKSDTIKEYNCIRLIGGELFDGFIHENKIENEFIEILQQVKYLIDNNIIEKVNVVTNLIYFDERDLDYVLNLFGNKITLSTSYDMFGRFLNISNEIMWWNNIKHLQQDYPNLQVDVGINVTQPFIEKVNKKWLDTFQKKLDKYSIEFNELFTGIDNKNKEDCIFKEYFPKRKDFIRFLQNLKQWNYLNTIIRKDDIQLIHLIFDEKGNIEFKDTSKIPVTNQSYIDSDKSMLEDIERIVDGNW